MKYFCTLCQVQILYKTPRGWIDHIRGVKHRKEKAAILKPAALQAVRSLRDSGELTKDEYKQISSIIDSTSSKKEIKEKITEVLEKSLIQVAQKHLSEPSHDNLSHKAITEASKNKIASTTPK